MRTRSLVALLPSVALLAACAADPVQPRPTPAAPSLAKGAADQGATTVTTRRTATIPFVIDGARCGLETTVRGTAEVEFVFHVTLTPNGEVHGFRNSHSHGTAVGDDGTRYVFNYVQNSRFLGATEILPPSGPLRPAFPFVREAIDVFHLVGAGGAPQIRVFQRFAVEIAADGSATLQLLEVRGDPSCDPI